MKSEPESRGNGRGLRRLRFKSALWFLFATAFSCTWLVGMYVKARRPMHPVPSLGLIYPLSWTIGCASCAAYYVTRFEYWVAGVPMFFAEMGILLVLIADGFLANGSNNSN